MVSHRPPTKARPKLGTQTLGAQVLQACRQVLFIMKEPPIFQSRWTSVDFCRLLLSKHFECMGKIFRSYKGESRSLPPPGHYVVQTAQARRPPCLLLTLTSVLDHRIVIAERFQGFFFFFKLFTVPKYKGSTQPALDLKVLKI